MTELRNGRPEAARRPGLLLASATCLGWLVLELLARYVPVIGAVLLSDAPVVGMTLGLAVGFPAAAAVLSWAALRHGHTVGTWDWEFSGSAAAAGVAGGLLTFALLFVTGPIDAAIFGDSNGSLRDAYRGLSAAVLLLFVVGNGVLVPIAEEQVWRGIVQTELTDGLGVVGGIALTALLFSLKHAVVDWSMGRFVTITVGGVVLGVLRYRWGTASSTLGHVVLNVIASTVVVGPLLM